MGFRNHLNTKVHAWSMYDWANSAFATSAAVAIVPVYFVSLFKASFGDSVDVLGFNFTGSSLWAFAGALSALTLVIVGPILGEIAAGNKADREEAKEEDIDAENERRKKNEARKESIKNFLIRLIDWYI